jgi:predicted S18 family serine protease
MRRLAVLFLLLPVLVMGACVDSTKTSTPLSPSIAGPIPGVNITAPTTIQPTIAAGFHDQQPL